MFFVKCGEISHSYFLEHIQHKIFYFAVHALKIENQPHDYSSVLFTLQLSSLADS